MGAISNRTTVAIEDLTVSTSTQQYGIGEKVKFIGNSDGTVSGFVYVKTGGALTQYVPYEIYHNGTTLTTRAPVTGAGLIGVPQVAMTSAYYGWLQIEGNATCAIGAETYVAGDQLEVLTTGVLANVDGSTGSTVRTVNSFGVSKASGSSATNIAIYMYGNDVTTVAAT